MAQYRPLVVALCHYTSQVRLHPQFDWQPLRPGLSPGCALNEHLGMRSGGLRKAEKTEREREEK